MSCPPLCFTDFWDLQRCRYVLCKLASVSAFSSSSPPSAKASHDPSARNIRKASQEISPLSNWRYNFSRAAIVSAWPNATRVNSSLMSFPLPVQCSQTPQIASSFLRAAASTLLCPLPQGCGFALRIRQSNDFG